MSRSPLDFSCMQQENELKSASRKINNSGLWVILTLIVADIVQGCDGVVASNGKKILSFCVCLFKAMCIPIASVWVVLSNN